MPVINQATIILGGNGYETVLKMLQADLNFSIFQNPDFLLLENDSLGIDDVRALERWAINRPLIGEVKVAFLRIGNFSIEAQNALLKMLEEPKLGTYFFLNLESLANVIPTLLSRVQVIGLPNENLSSTQSGSLEEKFLTANFSDRLQMVKNLIKKDDKQEMKNLIKSLENIAYQNKRSATSLKNILLAKVFVNTRGGSPKMLLEWLSCVL